MKMLFRNEIKDLVPNHKPLKKYSDKQLLEFLETNEEQPPNVLACICSEILRRQAKKSQLAD